MKAGTTIAALTVRVKHACLVRITTTTTVHKMCRSWNKGKNVSPFYHETNMKYFPTYDSIGCCIEYVHYTATSQLGNEMDNTLEF